MSTNEPSRRLLVGGLIGLPVLAACGGGESGGSGGEGGNGAPAAGPIGKASEVPVGGAKIFADQKVVVSQPTEGEFKAFSNVCTHRQCAITKLEGAEIVCGCHGSRFKVADGSVAHGPANQPLDELSVKVEGDELTLG